MRQAYSEMEKSEAFRRPISYGEILERRIMMRCS
jgi:hypothetical protein